MLIETDDEAPALRVDDGNIKFLLRMGSQRVESAGGKGSRGRLSPKVQRFSVWKGKAADISRNR
jgi:hypothetical protein